MSTELLTPTIEDFLAHTLYLTHCRNMGQRGLTWACLDKALQVKWREVAREAMANWAFTEGAQAGLRRMGDPKGRFFP